MSNSRYTAVHADAHDVDRHFDVKLEHAAGVLGQYLTDVSDVHTPIHVIDLAPLIVGRMEQYRITQEVASEHISGLMKARVTNESTGIGLIEKQSKAGRTYYAPGLVYLDLDDAYSRSFGLPDVPAIGFGSLLTTDRFYEPGSCEAVAVYFEPEFTEQRRGMWDGAPTSFASEWDPNGYQAIVRTFASRSAAKAARRELIEAVKTIATPLTDTAVEPDSFQDNSWQEPDLSNDTDF